MSERDNTPVYAVDKVKGSFLLDASVYIKITKRAEALGMSFNSLLNALLFEETKNYEWTEEDELRRMEIVKTNMAKRARKA